MPTIEERLRDTGRVWREHVDAAAPQETSTPARSRRNGSRRRVVLVAAAAVVVAGVGVPVAGVLAHRAADHNQGQQGFAASCAGPQLRLVGEQKRSQISVARAGQELTVTGRFYLDGCQDNGGVGTPRPLTVILSLRGHNQTVRLRAVLARGELGTFRATVRIPADYPLGTAKLTTHTVGPQAELAAGSPIEPILLTIVK
ncbi:hypothetical protein [Flexivirga alba]|uniref:Uncharacterized protein n=1 Tax=Flexivirga alba TaxID=702742 RepID=A0ABW2ADN0_9MICO